MITFTHFPHLLPPALAITNLIFVSSFTYQWDHTAFVFLGLTYFSSLFFFLLHSKRIPGFSLPAHEFPFRLCPFYHSTDLLLFSFCSLSSFLIFTISSLYFMDIGPFTSDSVILIFIILWSCFAYSHPSELLAIGSGVKFTVALFF